MTSVSSIYPAGLRIRMLRSFTTPLFCSFTPSLPFFCTQVLNLTVCCFSLAKTTLPTGVYLTVLYYLWPKVVPHQYVTGILMAQHGGSPDRKEGLQTHPSLLRSYLFLTPCRGREVSQHFPDSLLSCSCYSSSSTLHEFKAARGCHIFD